MLLTRRALGYGDKYSSSANRNIIENNTTEKQQNARSDKNASDSKPELNALTQQQVEE